MSVLPVTAKTPFVPGPIISAGKTPLAGSVSGQPILSEAILDWFRDMTIGIVTAAPQGSLDPTQDGVVSETVRSVRTSGCFQPGDPEKLDILPGGERSWQTGLLHTVAAFNVPTDSILVIAQVRYRITFKRDFSANGFVRYDLLEDYTPKGTPANAS